MGKPPPTGGIAHVLLVKVLTSNGIAMSGLIRLALGMITASVQKGNLNGNSECRVSWYRWVNSYVY